MKHNTKILMTEFREGYNLELSNKKRNLSFSSCNDFSIFLNLDVEEIKEIVKHAKGNIIEIDLNLYNEYSYRDKDNKMEVINFESKEDCIKSIEMFNFEKKISMVLEKVRFLEKSYNKKEMYTRNDIKSCYEDEYIMGVWDIEKYTEEKGEGFFYFEDFLLSFIEENLIFE